MDRLEAIVEACVRRLRAVLLTSITTVAGLAPILLETSLQAQFLKPMAVSLVFGLSFGTVLILLVVPSMLMIIEETKPRLAHFATRLRNAMVPSHLPATAVALWQFDPKQYRRAAEPEPGLRGSLWWPTALLGLYAIQLLQQSGVIVRAVQTSGVSLTVLLALALLILLLWLTGKTLEALLRQQLAVRGRARALVLAGVPLLLLASLISRLDPALHELAMSQWQLAMRLLLEGGLAVILLRWLRRARVTFRY